MIGLVVLLCVGVFAFFEPYLHLADEETFFLCEGEVDEEIRGDLVESVFYSEDFDVV